MPDRPAFSLTVGYGTETGGAEQLAGLFTADVTAVELNAVDADTLAAATHFVAITATYGEGEFPYAYRCSVSATSTTSTSPTPGSCSTRDSSSSAPPA